MANITRMNVMITANTKGLTTGLSKSENSIQSFSAKANRSLSSVSGVLSRVGSIGKGIAGGVATGIMKAGQFIQAGLSRIAIGATAAAAGLVYLTKSSIDAIGDTNDFAKSLGLTYTGLRNIQFAAQQAGVDSEQLSASFAKMSDTLGTAFGGDKAATDKLKNIGLSVEKLKQMNPAQQFETIAAAINRIQDPSEKMAAARDIFGKAGGKLISLFENAGQAIKDAAAALKNFGVTDSLNVEEIDKAGDAMGRVWTAVEGVGNQLANAVSPYIIQISDDSEKWIKSMGGINSIVNGGLSRMGDSLKWILDKTVYIQAAWREMKDILDSVAGVFDMLPESIKRAIKAAMTWNPIRDALVGDIQKHANDINREHSGVAGFRDRVGEYGRGALDAQSQSTQDKVQSDHDKRRDDRIKREREKVRKNIDMGRAGEAPQLSPSQQRAAQIIQGAQNRGVMPSGQLSRGHGPRERNYWERNGIPDPRLPAQAESMPGAQGTRQMASGDEDTNLLRQIAQNTGKNTVAYAG